MQRAYKSILLLVILLTTICYADETPAFKPVALYLTWQKDPTTTMTIQWITGADETQDILDYQKMGSGETNWKQVSGTHHPLPEEHPYLVHFAEIEKLEPNSSYTF